MLNRWFRRTKAPQAPTPPQAQYGVGTVAFLCEQDGPSERDLKHDLNRVFQDRLYVDSAYLVLADYEGTSDRHVVLCLTGVGNVNRMEILKEVGAVFARRFGEQAPASPVEASMPPLLCS